MPRELTQKDINDIIAVKSGITTTTYRRIRENELRLIISELQNNSYIKLQDFGEFKVKHEGGKDEIFFNEFGVPEKRYVEPKDFVEFIPNTALRQILGRGDKANQTFELNNGSTITVTIEHQTITKRMIY